jgi:hypothetical protein
MLPRKWGSKFFWFSKNLPGNCNRAKWLFIICIKFPIDRTPSCLIFEFQDFGRIMDVGHWPSLKIKILWFFHHQHEISDPKRIIMPYIENLGLGPDWGVGHRLRWPWVHTQNILGAETFRRSPHIINSDNRNSSYA